MIVWILAVKTFLLPTDPQLNQAAPSMCSCSIKSAKTQEMIEEMAGVARNQIFFKGIAAPQIGIRQRIILINRAPSEILPTSQDLKEYINPEILWRSDVLEWSYEECASTGSVCGIVPRSSQILIRAFDRKGNLISEELSGNLARAVQHEIDHLDGIRFPARIEQEAHLHQVLPNEKDRYRTEWEHWERKYPKSEWERLIR